MDPTLVPVLGGSVLIHIYVIGLKVKRAATVRVPGMNHVSRFSCSQAQSISFNIEDSTSLIKYLEEYIGV